MIFNQFFKKRILWVFITLILLLSLPIVSAYLLVKYGRDFLIQHQNRYGFLIEPPLHFKDFKIQDERGKDIDPALLGGKWLVLYVHQEKECSKICADRLISLRKIQLALGKEGSRVVNWLMSVGKPDSIPVDLKDMGLQHGQISSRMLNLFFNRPDVKEYADKSGFYIVDPLGNLMMAYPSSEDPNHLLKDLKRLLRASRIG